MARSVRLAEECLGKSGDLSLLKDIFAIHNQPAPHSLKSALQFIHRHRCRPAAPRNLRVTGVTESSISIAWDDVSDNEDGFDVTRRSFGGLGGDDVFTNRVGQNQQRHTFPGLLSGMKFMITVSAFNDEGKATSNEVVATTSSAQHPPTTGVSRVAFYNCHSARRIIYIWINDLTAATGWQSQGELLPQYDAPGTCPLVAVDPGGFTCGGQNDPTLVGCQRWSSTATGSSRGPIASVTIS